MTHFEFKGITGHSIGDQYGNGGYRWDEAEDREFDLSQAISAIYSLQLATEAKEKIKLSLKGMIDGIDTAVFPLNEVTPVKETEIKKGKKK
jgi:hypothetical protein